MNTEFKTLEQPLHDGFIADCDNGLADAVNRGWKVEHVACVFVQFHGVATRYVLLSRTIAAKEIPYTDTLPDAFGMEGEE